MTIKRIIKCYECGKVISDVFSSSVISLDDLNFAHVDCLE